MAGFSFNMGDLEKGLNLLENKADAAIRMYAETGGQKLVDSAKENRKWTDRTGRAGTQGKPERTEGGLLHEYLGFPDPFLRVPAIYHGEGPPYRCGNCQCAGRNGRKHRLFHQ